MDLPPAPPMPAPGSVPETPPRRRRWPWILGVVALVGSIALIGFIVVTRSGGDDGMPAEVASLPRLHTAEVQGLEQMIDSFNIDGVEIEVAAYGEDSIMIVLYRYSPFLPSTSVDSMLRGAGGGVIGSGGSADLDDINVIERGGVEYRCIPFKGRLFPADPEEAEGFICGWPTTDALMLSIDTTTTNAGTAASHAETTQRTGKND